MMFDIIREHQLNIMLVLCAVCSVMALLLLFTQYLSERRKWILILMELVAACLIGFDRAAYLYKGDMSVLGSVMVRVSNFIVFFLTSGVVLCFNLYLTDLLRNDAKQKVIPRRLKAVSIGAAAGMGLVVLSQFTGLYYYFDDQNVYHRGPGFLLCYLVPVVFPIVQFTVIRQFRKSFRRLIYISLVLYIFVPIAVGILQIFAYGLSIVNMAMVLVSICLYIFTYLDINAEAEKMHELEVGVLQKEQQSMKRLFDQTIMAFVSAAEKRDAYSAGHSIRVADCARRIATIAGKSVEECDEVYYTALLHDVWMMEISDSVLQQSDAFTEEELQQKIGMSAEILSSIREYPYLSQCTRYCREHYDGTGLPEGRRGQEIPEISRIIAVAHAYDRMNAGNRSRKPLSYQVMREEFIKESGLRFDPKYAEIMVRMLDSDRVLQKQQYTEQTETELVCGGYRDHISGGIRVDQAFIRIAFACETAAEGFSAPSVIVFDSYDRHVHEDASTIEANRYLEYGEIWFDGHYVATNARNMEVRVTECAVRADGYEIIAGRYEDHLSIRMCSPDRTVEIIMALPDNSKASYISLTGENCRIRDITVQKTGEKTEAGMIRQIVSKIRYTDRLESDLPNLQIDHTRSAATEGLPVKETLIVDFHAMTLPSANLVWHCPYIVLFDASDHKVGGKGYKEYALIKLNGESSGNTRDAENRLVMKKNDTFPGWDIWKQKYKEGLECSVRFVRKGARIVVSAETLGIEIEHTVQLHDKKSPVYAALTGDQVALTDIRVR